MVRCSQCGRVNREGALFCQECGKKLTEAAAPKPAAGPMCPSCGTVNVGGMNFCKMCGTALGKSEELGVAATIAPAPAPAPTPAPTPVATPAAPATGAGPGKLICTHCGKPTPVGFQFCQHCGQRAPTAAAEGAPAPRPLTPPAGVSKIASAPVPAVSRPTPSPDAFAQTVAPSSLSAVASTTAARPQPAAQPTFGRLVQVNRDGSDGDTTSLVGDLFDIGRWEGALRFEEGPYLAPRHLRLLAGPGRVVLQALDRVNGVYIKVRGGIDLESGDLLLIGKELLRFELLTVEEQAEQPVFDQGVRLLGSVTRTAWARLRQLTGSGTSGDLWHLSRDEYVLGREEGDLVFGDDEFMSRRHAAVRRTGTKLRLEDLGSSNGTFLRVRRERTLQSGDVLRLGDQLLRFEV